jgi:hypothetical protein
MALKAVLPSKTDVDALPESVRAFYKQSGDKFVLDLEGAPEGFVTATEHLNLKTQLAEFRDNNRSLFAKVQELEPLKAKFEGVDPDEYKRLKKAVEDKGGKKGDDLEAIIQNAVAAATKPIADKLAQSEAQAAEARAAANRSKFREIVGQHAAKARVRATGQRHVLREAEEIFEYKPEIDDLVPKNGRKDPSDPLKDLTPAAWLLQLAKSDDYLFEPSVGAGTSGNGTGGTPSHAKELVNPTPEEMGRHRDAIAKGEMVVVRR